MASLEDHLNLLNEKLESVPFINQVAETIGVKPALIGIVAACFLLGFLLFGVGGSIIANMVGFLYPAYESFRVLENQDNSEMRFWLT